MKDYNKENYRNENRINVHETTIKKIKLKNNRRQAIINNMENTYIAPIIRNSNLLHRFNINIAEQIILFPKICTENEKLLELKPSIMEPMFICEIDTEFNGF